MRKLDAQMLGVSPVEASKLARLVADLKRDIGVYLSANINRNPERVLPPLGDALQPGDRASAVEYLEAAKARLAALAR